MQVVEISEPGEKVGIKDDLVVGIDFGTTHSLIAISKEYKAKIIKIDNGLELIPSIIGFDSNSVAVGKKAIDYKNRVKSIKRLLAKSYSEIRSNPSLSSLSPDIYNDNGTPKVKVLEKSRTLPEMASEIFKYLKNQAEHSLQRDIQKAVISVPAYFNEESRGQILLAAKLAGLSVIRLISEPTAAAYSYGLNKLNEGSYLVYDLGGGTFDVSILNMQSGVLQVIATGGDSMFGGDNIDYALAEHIHKELGVSISTQLIETAKQIKENFSIKNKTTVSIEGHTIVISKKKYQEITSPMINNTLKITQDLVDELEDVKLDGIILVGGSTKDPQIVKKLHKVFKLPIYNNINQEKVVALGAAMQAENLTFNSNSLLIDVIPLSVGLELHGGIAEKIILRNTPIPFSVTKEYTTHVDNQTAIKLHIIQGEREMANDCRSLSHFELTGIKKSKSGKARIHITFSIDANGILSISAVDLDSSKTQNIEISPSYGLNKNYVNNILEEAYRNASHDHTTRLLVESQDSAKSLIRGIESALNETPGVVEELEQKKIEEAISCLKKALVLNNRDIILSKIEKLNRLAAHFIQKHLDKGAELLLKNRYISEIKT